MQERVVWSPEKGWHMGYAAVALDMRGHLKIDMICCKRGLCGEES